MKPLADVVAHNPVQPNTTILVALSGGLDSCVLLHWLLAHYPAEKLRVVHVNHQLQPCADAMAAHCESYAQSLGVHCEIKTVTAQPPAGMSLEAWARDARYSLLHSQMQSHDVLVTAHHADDQAETVLLNLFRGAGVMGLSAMPTIKALSTGQHWRPLLCCSRAKLEAYAHQHQLQWFDDPSNDDQRFDRNFIRQTVIPMIASRWPAITDHLGATAQHCQQALAIEQAWVQSHLPTLMQGNTLQLDDLPVVPAQRVALIRAFLHAQSAPIPSQKQLDVVLKEVIDAQDDANPVLKLGTGEIRRYRNTLYWFDQPVATQIENYNIAWDGVSDITVPGFGTVTAQHLSALGLSHLPKQLCLRNRRGGEHCRPVDWQHTKPLKDCYQAFAIPPWRRYLLPLLFADKQLIAVIGGWACH